MTVYHGGYHTYGQAVGILMLETQFPRIPGDIGHPGTFPFPVMYKVIPGASIERAVDQGDQALLGPFIQGALELQEAGVRLVTTSCGFLSLFQREMAEALRVPMITSSLIQVPMVSRMVGGRTVGIFTTRQAALTERHFNAAGWSSKQFKVVVRGMDGTAEYHHRRHSHPLGSAVLDFDRIQQEAVERARELVDAAPDVSAIVIETTNLPPYADIVQQAVDLPVFSIVTLSGARSWDTCEGYGAWGNQTTKAPRTLRFTKIFHQESLVPLCLLRVFVIRYLAPLQLLWRNRCTSTTAAETPTARVSASS